MKKILIIQTAFIGDVVLATGIGEKLHQYFPSATIDFVVKKGNEGVFEQNPWINNIHEYNKRKKLAGLFNLLITIRREKYDLVVNVHRFASSGILTAFSGARSTRGFIKNPLSVLFSKRFPHHINRNGSLHEIERNHILIADLTDALPGKPKLYIEQIANPFPTNKNFVCIAPASVWFTKQFPADKWGDIIRAIPADYEIVLMGGKDDAALCHKIRSISQNENVKVLAGKLSLLQSAAIMKRAVVTFVNDSAPLHLASSVNAAVCVVYCSTVPQFGFGPLSDFARIIQIKYDLSCRPCNLHGFKQCPQGHFKCAHDILTEDFLKVWEEAKRFAEKKL